MNSSMRKNAARPVAGGAKASAVLRLWAESRAYTKTLIVDGIAISVNGAGPVAPSSGLRGYLPMAAEA